MNSGCDGAGAGVEVTVSGRVTGAESEGRLRSVTTSELGAEVVSPAGDTVGETVVGDGDEGRTGFEGLEGLERSMKILSLSVNKLSLELCDVSVVKSVSVSVLTVATGVMGAGSGRTVC